MKTFDGLDNRKEVMVLLQRLGSDRRRAQFLESLIPKRFHGIKVAGNCDPVAAYFMLVGVCNELGVSIDDAAKELERVVKRGNVRPV